MIAPSAAAKKLLECQPQDAGNTRAMTAV